MSDRPKRILAVASGGGHWIQLLRLRPAFAGCDVTYVTTRASNQTDVPGERFRQIPDSNLSTKFKLLRTCVAMLWILVRERPDVVVTTGAAPGYFAVRFGRWFGARTAWIDSVANAEELSLAGRKAGSCVDLWLTQWAHLARNNGPRYYGSVL
jgi:UDP-N-acetylglucosamine:LPS N-acetylglucosamine transferase